MTNRPSCEVCRDAYLDKPIDPPCKTCFPGIHRFNEAAAIIYMGCGDQYIQGPGGATTLSIQAAQIVFDWYKVRKSDRSDLWEKINIIAGTLIQAHRDKAEAEANMNKKRGY